MTVGALYQIKNLNSNAANNFLDFDPQISFFKKVYRKHTRFAMENITFDNLSRNTMNFDNNVIITCDIPRNADLLHNLYFTFELPAIYSGKYTTTSTPQYEYNYEFQWIKNIGTNIFNYVSLKVSNQEIDRVYSDYFTIWKELMLNDNEKKVYDRNIGSIPEIYDPANGLGMNGNYPNITSESTQSQKWINNKTQVIEYSNFSGNNDNLIPSIHGQKIKVPLLFWFCNNSGLALPLISLQYSVVSLEFEMKPFKDLYTFIDPKFETNSKSFKRRIKPSSESHHSISNFTSNYSYNIRPNVEGEYIFLDDEERRRFALNDQEYLITQSRITNKDGVQITSQNEETMAKLVPAFNPVSFITWVIKRDDLKNVNDWNNYSNWVYEDIPPYSYEYNKRCMKYDTVLNKRIFYDNEGDNNNHRNFYNINTLKKNILKSARIEYDGNLRIDKDADYFSKQQIQQHFKNNCKDGIYVYSFSINPKEYQPSGSCNFSNINIPRLYFKRNTIENFNYYNHKAFIFIISYNIFTITSGMGSLKFTN